MANTDPTEKGASATPKFRFWLSLAALVAAMWFGTLGLGAFAAGEGLAGENGPDHVDRAIITFGIVGLAFFALTAICLYLAWRFRPGGG